MFAEVDVEELKREHEAKAAKQQGQLTEQQQQIQKLRVEVQTQQQKIDTQEALREAALKEWSKQDG